MAIPPRIEVPAHSGRGLGHLTTDGVLVLQRRGTSNNLEADLPGVSIIVHPAVGMPGEWVVTARAPGHRRDATRHPSLSSAYARAAATAADVVGIRVTAAPFIDAYMYAPRPCGPTEGIPDRVVSPLFYDPAAAAVRIVESGATVARFPGGAFDPVTVPDEPDVLHVREHVLRGLERGFHDCDRRLGDDHCKRRLAWLAGAYWLEAAPASLRCGVLRLDMSIEDAATAT